jgi:AcrR family transcriptional regulator
VLDAAEQIFAEGGFADASMSAIATRAGVSKAVLYDCFPGGKQEIFFSLLDRGEETITRHVLAVLDKTNKLPLEDALRQGITAFLAYAAENRLAFQILFSEAGSSDPEIVKRSRRAKDRMVAKMGERTRQIMEAGGVPITNLADLYNRAIVSVIEEMARWLHEDDTLRREQLVEALVRWMMDGFSRIIPGDAWAKPADV